MNRDEMIEAMAYHNTREFYPNWDESETEFKCALAAEMAEIRGQLLAFCDAIPGLADVLDGKAVIVPVAPTPQMTGAGWPFISQKEAARCFVCMLAARPYRRQK